MPRMGVLVSFLQRPVSLLCRLTSGGTYASRDHRRGRNSRCGSRVDFCPGHSRHPAHCQDLRATAARDGAGSPVWQEHELGSYPTIVLLWEDAMRGTPWNYL